MTELGDRLCADLGSEHQFGAKSRALNLRKLIFTAESQFS